MPAPPNLLANAVNPFLVFVLLIAPFVTPRRISQAEYWGRSALGIGLAVLLAESGKHFEVWRGHSNFPSGHETFGLAAATCLLARDIRWIWLALPLTAALAWALVAAGFHKPAEVAGSLIVGPPSALLCHFWKHQKQS